MAARFVLALRAGALLKASLAIDVKGDNEDQNARLAIIRKALQAPIRQTPENAGVEGSIVVGKILETKGANYGYDAQKDGRGDMIEKGIVDLGQGRPQKASTQTFLP